MNSHISKTILFSILILFLVFPKFATFEEEDLEEICQFEKLEGFGGSLSREEYQKILEKCREYYEGISSQIEKDIKKTEKEKKTLQNKIYILRSKIKNLDYQIYQSNLMIKDLGIQVEDTKSSIEKTSLKIDDSNGSSS